LKKLHPILWLGIINLIILAVGLFTWSRLASLKDSRVAEIRIIQLLDLKEKGLGPEQAESLATDVAESRAEADLWLGNTDTVLAFTVVACALLTFFSILALGNRLGEEWRLDKGGMRNAITVAIVVTYFIVLTFSVFLSPPSSLNPLTETLIANFTTVVGAVIAFYFGASAYIQVSQARATEKPGETPPASLTTPPPSPTPMPSPTALEENETIKSH
jgi:hypothetical protein